jgi:hypothetical protein
MNPKNKTTLIFIVKRYLKDSSKVLKLKSINKKKPRISLFEIKVQIAGLKQYF